LIFGERELFVSPHGTRFDLVLKQSNLAHWGPKRTAHPAPAIMILMLAAAGINMLVFRASAAVAVKGNIMNAGVIALISIAGLGWRGSSFFEGVANSASVLRRS
jgi:anaerobic C4-dicarboxylate transporter